MITEKNKKVLKEYGYVVESESPLKIIGEGYQKGQFFNGITALALIDSFDEDDSSELSELDSLEGEDILLITAEVNYADEFDMSEWTTMTVSEFKEIVDKLKKYEDEIEWGFGTNEDLRFSDGEELLSCLSFRKITEQEAHVLKKLFGGGFDGGCHVFDSINNLDDGDDEEVQDETDDGEEDDDEILDREELKMIETLKGFGWVINVIDEDSYIFEFKNDNGDSAIAHISFIDDLHSFHKRKLINR